MLDVVSALVRLATQLIVFLPSHEVSGQSDQLCGQPTGSPQLTFQPTDQPTGSPQSTIHTIQPFDQLTDQPSGHVAPATKQFTSLLLVLFLATIVAYLACLAVICFRIMETSLVFGKSSTDRSDRSGRSGRSGKFATNRPDLVTIDAYADDKVVNINSILVSHRVRYFAAAKPSHDGLVMIFHNKIRLASQMTDYVDLAEKANMACILVEYPGYADSSKPSQKRILQNALVVYDHVVDNFASLAKKRIFVVGEALGSAVATWLASQRLVNQLILWNCFPSAAHLLCRRPGWFSWIMANSFDATGWARRVIASTLIICTDQRRRLSDLQAANFDNKELVYMGDCFASSTRDEVFMYAFNKHKHGYTNLDAYKWLRYNRPK